MRKTLLAIGLAVLCTTMLTNISSAKSGPTVVHPADLKWSPVEGLPGAQMAVVSGDPMGTGMYTLRLKLAAGTKVPAHWHPSEERVTILSGTFMFGLGDKFDMAHLMVEPAGTFALVPARMHHYAMAKTEVILQSTGAGPFKMVPVK